MGNYGEGLYGTDVYSGTTIIEEILAVLPLEIIANMVAILALFFLVFTLFLRVTNKKK